jgi:hypothetical protein
MVVSLKRSNLVCFFLKFVPGNGLVKGNERADRLAGTAVIYNGRAMENVNVFHALGGVGWMGKLVTYLEIISQTLRKD